MINAVLKYALALASRFFTMPIAASIINTSDTVASAIAVNAISVAKINASSVSA